jgi:hypothetical protein
MMNIYTGNVFLDDDGEATVILPDWFTALNCDFRYHLTPLGHTDKCIYIKQEINPNDSIGKFTIAGGSIGSNESSESANLEVSWMVTGIRKDKYAKENPIIVEVDKGDQKGKYLHPKLFL